MQQIHRRLAEGRRPASKRNKPILCWPVLRSRINLALPLNCKNSHGKLVFENFTLTTRQPNNCCMLDDKTIIQIHHIGTKNDEIIVIVQKFLRSRGIDNYHCDSSLMGICKVEGLSDLEIIPARNITKKCCLFVRNEVNYTVPLLHH